ncbi:MAG TPA: transcription termination/antitermination protein NusA [Elusimicrobia bacterium]|nr:transcription termination/antitermination protein NusA [Elusimicrobiota bacterium]HBT61699.1 transcription termination/antitermination protein NusA [Elusimicrobiota bacterium]
MAKSELVLALEQLEREKGIKKDDILKMIEGAVVSSLRKHVGKTTVIEASIDPDTAEFRANVVKKVAEAVADPELEISLAEARRYKKDAAIGEDVRLPAPVTDFARIAAQTAKQVLAQKIREVERDTLYDEFKPKEGEVVTGSVHRFLERNIVVDIGKTEAILPVREQIRRERYNVGGNVRAVILRVDKAQRGPQVVISRAAPLFLRRLFELEVPEIGEKIVEILEVARDPGFRAKVLVRSNDPKVDPVGSCVGLRGSRIRSIMNELAGERIDLILFDEDIPKFLANSLAPAKVASVRVLDAENKRAEALVSQEQLSLAIGKDGQNVRLACRLTGWEIEVRCEAPAQAGAASGDDRGSVSVEALSVLEGVGAKTAEILARAGFADPARLAEADPEALTSLEGIGEKTAAKIIASAKKYMSGQAPQEQR